MKLPDELQQRALAANGQGACDNVGGHSPELPERGVGKLKAKNEVNEMMGAEVHLCADCQDGEVVMIIPTAA